MTTAPAHPGRPTKAETQLKLRIAQSRASGKIAKPKRLPEYLEPPEVSALIDCAPHFDAELVMSMQWCAGLRISEALGVEARDLNFSGEPATLKVRWQTAKGMKERLVPLHPMLKSKLHGYLRMKRLERGQLVRVDKSTAWRWYKKALKVAQKRGLIPYGRKVATHTLRHSEARHWIASGVPINQVSVWLGHASIQTTLIYLQLLPDPSNYMERVSY